MWWGGLLRWRRSFSKRIISVCLLMKFPATMFPWARLFPDAAAGTKVKEQRIIHLTVSKGGTVILVPDLKGLTLDQARERLEKMNLSVGAIENGSDPSMPPNVIISQSPSPSSKVDKNTLVNIVINTQVQEKVPDLTGMSLQDAQKALISAHLTVGNVSASDGRTKVDDPQAVVVSQSPKGSSTLAYGGTVDLVLAQRRKPLTPMRNGGLSIFPFPRAESPRL